MTETDKSNQPQALQEKPSQEGLSLKILSPRIEGDSLTLTQTEMTARVVDWRQPVDTSELTKAFSGAKVDVDQVVIINIDEQDPIMNADETPSGPTDPMNMDYHVTDTISISDGKATYRTSYDKTVAYLSKGERTSIHRVPEGSIFQQPIIGVAENEDLAGKVVYSGCRVSRYNDGGTSGDLRVDGVMVYGSMEKMKPFLESIAKSPVPPAKHTEPAYQDGHPVW